MHSPGLLLACLLAGAARTELTDPRSWVGGTTHRLERDRASCASRPVATGNGGLVPVARLSAPATAARAKRSMSGGHRHVLFHDGSVHSEGVGAKWREVKYAVWLVLRVNWLLQSHPQSNATLAWLPNPAMMQNPHLDEHRSMMGGLGILDAGMPVLRETPAWLEEQVQSGAYSVVELQLEQKKFAPLPGLLQSSRTGHTAASDRALERKVLAAMASAGRPVAFYLRRTEPMHWHGSAGRWLHDAFISHRLRRAQRATGHAALALPTGVDAGRYLISVHIRTFGIPAWDLPASYFVSVVRTVFEATPLSCANAAILVIGPADAAPSTALAAAFECVQLLARTVTEDRGEPTFDKQAGDDYGAADDANDARRGFVFRDLELLALSDVLIGSNSEFSRLAQSLSAPDTLVLCAPRRPLSDNYGLNRGLACDDTGVPNSILTRVDDELPSSMVTHVDAPRVAEAVAEAWQRRGANAAPIWTRPRHGLVPFDFAQPIEEARWLDSDDEALAFASKEAASDNAGAASKAEQRMEL